MNKFYDWVIVTPISAFYKVNLYNKLAEKFRLLVVVVASTSCHRQDDFYGKEYAYDVICLWDGDLEKRSRLKTLWRLKQTLSDIQCDRVLVGGWDLPEFWLTLFLLPTAHHILALESSCYESRTQGLSAILKRLFLKMIQTVIASGEAQIQLARLLGFQKRIVRSHGVGLFHVGQGRVARAYAEEPKRFLFVGRLAPEKNIALLLSVFRDFPTLSLTIVGAGVLGEALRQAASDNVRFVGHVRNASLSDYYQTHDVFILPSLAEPWGLVVEEALYYGLPVIVSDKVGCAEDLVRRPGTGYIFNVQSEDALRQALQEIQNPVYYAMLCQAVKKINFDVLNAAQVNCYGRILHDEITASS